MRPTIEAHRQSDCNPIQPLLDVMYAFAPMGIGLVAEDALTGLINCQLIFGLETSAMVLTTSYGLLLAAKVVLVGTMLAFGGQNAWVGWRGALAEDGAIAGPGLALSTLRRSLAGELALAFMVTGLVAMLGMMPPTMI